MIVQIKGNETNKKDLFIVELVNPFKCEKCGIQLEDDDLWIDEENQNLCEDCFDER